MPTDGPGGEWLRATGRQPMRPAHIHARVEADGHRPLITHLFVAGDPYLDIDAAFGVRDGLVLDFPVQDGPAEIEANAMPGPYFDISYDLVLVPAAGWRRRHSCPPISSSTSWSSPRRCGRWRGSSAWA